MKRVLVPALLLAACGGAKPEAVVPAPPTSSAAAPAVAAAEPAAVTSTKSAPARKIRTVEGITEYQLANGLQVLLFPDATQSTVTVNVTYLVGSRHEGYGETGMAHLLEHMMFKGTPTHRNVLKLLGEKGASANGTTWLDRTNYFETLPASQENLDWTLALEADRMRNASISPDDLKTEFSVVRNEFEMGENNPQAILDERIVSTAFLWHNYGKSTIGSRSDIERVPVPALRAFYEKYYQPDNAVLVVSGKYDDAKALASVEKMFGSIPRPTRVLAPTYSVEPAQDGERTVTLRRNGDVNVIGLAYHTVAGTSDDFPAVEAALDMLTREPAGRLYKKLVETKLAASIDSTAMATHDPFLAQLSADVRDAKNVATVEKIMIEEMEGLAASKIDDKAVARWRVATLKELELAMADSERIAVELSEYAALGDWRTLFAYRNRVEKVTVADVQRVAKTYFKASNRTLGKFIPTKDIDRAPLTETPDINAYVKGIEGGEVKEQGEVFQATLDNIEQRTTRTQLKGGIKAALLPKKTRGGKVELNLALHWGDEKSLQNKSTQADMLGSVLVRGTTKKSYQDLQDLEDQLKAHIWFSTSADGLTLHIETLRDKLPAALDLAVEMLKTPSFPDKELEIVRQEQLSSLEQQLQEPMAVAFQTVQQLTTKWPKGDPRYPESTTEQIAATKKVTMAEIKQFYRDFVGAGYGELSVVGDFDPKALTAQIEQHFEKWQTKKPYKRLEGKAFGVPGATKSVDIKDKEMTTLALSHDIQMKDTDADYAAWLMASQILGGDAASRAWMRLREKEGLSYGVATWAFADAFDNVGGFGGYAIVAPQNLAKAKASLLDEIEKLTTSKVTDEELRRAKETWIKEQDTGLSSDGYVIQMLSRQTFRGRTTAYTKELRAKIQAVTADDVARVAKKYLDPKRLVIVDAGDVSKQQKK
ncbi:MAG TPA: pitrilysin family protein [Kofleriaceae bacterium]|nr:pitrilysin family protein [Kofleriaceae bacterium]